MADEKPANDTPSAPLDEESESFGREPLRERLHSLRSGSWLRRNGLVILTILASLLVSPYLVQYYGSFRGIVLQKKGQKSFLALPDKEIPRWQSGVPGNPGDIVVKKSGSWEADVVPPEPEDEELLRLYERWMRTYSGVIERMITPRTAAGAYTAVISLDGGGTLHLEIWADHLAGAEAGRRIRKFPNSWDPVFDDTSLPAPNAPPSGATTTPGPPTSPAVPAQMPAAPVPARRPEPVPGAAVFDPQPVYPAGASAPVHP